MPPIRPADIRHLTQQLATDGKLDKKDIDSLVDAAMADKVLSRSERKELAEVLTAHADKIDSPDTRKRLEGFLGIQNASIREIAVRLERDDGVLDLADADKIADLVNKDGKVSSSEKYSLRAVMLGTKMADAARDRLRNLTGDEAAPTPAGPAVTLGKTQTERPVFLSSSGFFVEDAALDKPRNNAELASGLFRMAQLVDDAKTNPLAAGTIPAAAQGKILSNLAESLAKVAVGAPLPDGLDAKQALQARSSGVTVLLGLVSAATGETQRAAFDLYKKAMAAETHPGIRDSMIFNLHAAKDTLPAEMKAVSDEFMREVAPLSPPYEDWFKDGNRTLNVSWTSGQGTEGFHAGTVEMLKNKGYKVEGQERAGGPTVLTKAIKDRTGVEYTVRITTRENRDNIFDKMNDDKFHIVGYDGHSDIGRAVPEALEGAPASTGKKLIFTGLCAGKDNIHALQDKYPDAQVLTTFNSSYFNTTDVGGGKKRMSRSENFNVLMSVVENAVDRRPWTTINQDIRDNAVLFPWSHVMPGGTNYISPAHTMIRRRVLDQDHDGQADVLDRLFNVDTTRVNEDTAREFNPVTSDRPADKLDGTRVHLAAMGLNTATGYNSVTQPYKKSNIIGDGYFQPQPGETAVVKFEKTKVEGQDVLLMKVNAQYAHMSTESLRAVAHYQFIQDTCGSMDVVDRKLMGLTFGAFSIMYDRGGYSRDPAIWRGLLKAAGLPTDISMSKIQSLLDAEHHDYSGNTTHVKEWRASLPASVIDALKAG
jgi:hypothetical protein